MSAARLEKLVNTRDVFLGSTIVDPNGIPYSCVPDESGGWDYFCAGNNSIEAFYAVSTTTITGASVINIILRPTTGETRRTSHHGLRGYQGSAGR